MIHSCYFLTEAIPELYYGRLAKIEAIREQETRVSNQDLRGPNLDDDRQTLGKELEKTVEVD